MDNFDLKKYLAEGKLSEAFYGSNYGYTDKELRGGDKTLDDADRWVEFLEQKLDLENLKKEFGATLRSEEDYAVDYYNIIDKISAE